MIAIFLGNKLITTDTVVPMALAIKRMAPKRRLRFYVFDEDTYRSIRQNTVLWDAIGTVGSLVCLANPGSGLRRKLYQLRMMMLLVPLAVRCGLGKARLVHFKALNSGPLSLLSCLNETRTVLMEGNCWGYNKLMMEQIGDIGQPRVRSGTAGKGAALIAFSEDWPELRLQGSAQKTKHVVPSSHFTGAWLDFVAERSDKYLASDFKKAGLEPSQTVLVYILGYFGRFRFLRSERTMLRLFGETLDVLSEVAGDVPVFLKPHAITDVEIVRQELARRKKDLFLLSYLHPAVLASRAVAFVGNHYSTTFGDAVSFGVPTIEYTDYNAEALELTGGTSMRPDHVTHFIDRDPAELKRVLAELLARPQQPKLPAPRDAEMWPALQLLAN